MCLWKQTRTRLGRKFAKPAAFYRRRSFFLVKIPSRRPGLPHCRRTAPAHPEFARIPVKKTQVFLPVFPRGKRRRGTGRAQGSSPHPGERRKTMPAKSKSQQKAAAMALAAKRGEMDESALQGAAREMYETMREDQLEDFAESPRKGKPETKSG